MKVGLIDIEPKIINTAYMQIAGYHRSRGDDVGWAAPLEYDKYDILYCSSLFDFSNKSQVPKQAICGGTGFNLTSRLSVDMEHCQYDYSIYPECDYSIVWFSRGCCNKCPFCVVPEKEGRIRAVEPLELNPNGKYITVQDNNFFASRGWAGALLWLNSKKQPVNINGIDVRCISNKKAKELSNLRLAKDQSLKIAWDNPRENILPKLRTMLKYIKPGKLMCYMLIGYWSTHEENVYRVYTLWDRFGVRPYVMSYDNKNDYQNHFERWVNGHFYKNINWEDYR